LLLCKTAYSAREEHFGIKGFSTTRNRILLEIPGDFRKEPPLRNCRQNEETSDVFTFFIPVAEMHRREEE